MDKNELYQGINKQTIIRIETIIILYENKINNKDYKDILANKEDDEYSSEVASKVEHIFNNIVKIDNVIEQNLVGYSITRLNILDLAIIEQAVYELLFTDIHPNIIINEALNISKVYTDTANFNSVKFNNRLLDNIAKSLGRL